MALVVGAQFVAWSFRAKAPYATGRLAAKIQNFMSRKLHIGTSTTIRAKPAR